MPALAGLRRHWYMPRLVFRPPDQECFMAETADYKVADLSLADWGRRELSIAESEMPLVM